VAPPPLADVLDFRASSAVALVAAGLALSAALRPSVALEPPVDPVRDGGPLAALCVPDRERLWAYRPGSRAFQRVAGARIRVRTNELGLRGPRIPPQRPDDACSYRVLVIGGSNTFGWGVAERERYTELLSARLVRHYPGLTLVNAGHWSYSLDQQLALLRDLLPRVRPDVVIQAVTPRAVALLGAHDAASAGPGSLVGNPFGLGGAGLLLGSVPAAAWARGRSVVEETRRVALASGARYLLVALPAAPASGRMWPAALGDSVGPAGLHVVDLRASRTPEFHARSGTWTSAGHFRVAQALTPYVQAELDAVSIQRQRADLSRVRELVLSLEPSLQKVADHASVDVLASALRDFVHRRVPLRPPPRAFDFLPLFASFRSAVLDRGAGHLCGGIALTYMMALEAFGIPARYVGLHASPSADADNHVSVEYLDGGRWIASDPTFDVAFVAEGRRLGWLEVRERLLSGAPVAVSTGGYRVAPGRRIESYYAPLEKLVAYLVVYADLNGDGLLEPNEVATAPASWDGTLEGGHQPRWKHAPSGVYRVLGSRPP
jgi:hypothetical protein